MCCRFERASAQAYCGGIRTMTFMPTFMPWAIASHPGITLPLLRRKPKASPLSYDESNFVPSSR